MWLCTDSVPTLVINFFLLLTGITLQPTKFTVSSLAISYCVIMTSKCQKTTLQTCHTSYIKLSECWFLTLSLTTPCAACLERSKTRRTRGPWGEVWEPLGYKNVVHSQFWCTELHLEFWVKIQRFPETPDVRTSFRFSSRGHVASPATFH